MAKFPNGSFQAFDGPPEPLPAELQERCELMLPPGLTGEIAKYILRSAYRPVNEVAIVGALGLMAGICGRTYTVSGQGLNQYLILVARSAVGKEAMHGGIGMLLSAVREYTPDLEPMVTFNSMASGQALKRACAEAPFGTLLAVQGEFGHTLRQLAQCVGTKGQPHVQELRRMYTDLYHKSGTGARVGGTTRADKANDIDSVEGMAFSMVGETTPGLLYAAVDDSMMEDGFMSRFSVVEYTGDRPPPNDELDRQPSQDLVELLVLLVRHVVSHTNNQRQRVAVELDGPADWMQRVFEKECDRAIIAAGPDEGTRQVWNRAHLKALRIAALLAVGDNPEEPTITTAHLTWGISLVRRDVAIFLLRKARGDIGDGDDVRLKKLTSLLRAYIVGPAPSDVPAVMHKDGVVPWRYMQRCTGNIAAFKNHPFKAKRALTEAVEAACMSGYMIEMDKVKATEAYTFQGRCYRIVQLP